MNSFRDNEHNVLESHLYTKTEGLLSSEELVTTLSKSFASPKNIEGSSSNEIASNKIRIPEINGKQIEQPLRRSEKDTVLMRDIRSHTQTVDDASNCFIPEINKGKLEQLSHMSENETVLTYGEEFPLQCASNTQTVNDESISIRDVEECASNESIINRNVEQYARNMQTVNDELMSIQHVEQCVINESNSIRNVEQYARNTLTVNDEPMSIQDVEQCASNTQTFNDESISFRDVNHVNVTHGLHGLMPCKSSILDVGHVPDNITLTSDSPSTCHQINISGAFSNGGVEAELPTVFERSCSITDLHTPQKFRMIRHRVFNNLACLRGCKWSPDGNYLLCNASDNILRVFSGSHLMRNFAAIDGGGITYDYDWYPSSEPYALRASSLGPVHLWDVNNRRVIASYSTFDATDEVIRAMTCVSSPDGEILYCGAEKMISIFNTNRPGRDCQILSIKKHCQRGIVSTIAVNPAKSSLIAFGTYNKYVVFYDKRQPLCVFEGHSNGVTCVKFSPDGLVLYSGARGCGEMFAWDLRKPGETIFKMERAVRTQQRIYFDLSPDGRFLFSGSTDGVVRIWDTEGGGAVCNNNVLNSAEQFEASEDCVNGISLHPDCEILATTSGQYGCNFNPNVAKKDVSLKLWLLSDTNEVAR